MYSCNTQARAHTKPISLTFERACQSTASLPWQWLRVSTETDVSRGGRLSGLRRGVEHSSCASHSKTTGGAVHGEEPGLHNLGQCCWSHPYDEEGSHREECRRHRPTWILASSIHRSHPPSAVISHPDAMNPTETQAGENPWGSHIRTRRELSARK